MAIKTIDLVINTSRGEQNVKKLHQLAKQVEKTFGNINKLKLNIQTAPAQKKLTALQKEINKGNRKIATFFEGANPGVKAFANSIGKARDELSSVRKAFDAATNSTGRQNAATVLLAGNFKKLRMEAAAFAMASGADPKKTIGSVGARLKEIEKFPRTILAGNEAMTLLKRMQEMTVAGSKEFLQVSRAIGEQLKVNATIQMAASRAAKPMKDNQVFATPEQIKALKGNKLIPPSMRLPQAGESSGKFVEIQSKPIQKAVNNIQKSSAKTANLLTQQSAFGLLPPGTAGASTGGFGATGGQIGPRELTRFEKAGFGKFGKSSGLFSFPGGATGRLKGGVGSAMIGGGFPALFGAGGLSSLMGGVAGGIGGALAPGGGFAASILATAVAAEIDKARAFRKAIKELNEDMNSMGISSTFTRQEIKKLGKEFDLTNDESVQLASQFKTFGADFAKSQFATFGKDAKLIFESLSGLRDTQSVLGKIETLSEKISETKRREILQTLATEGSLKGQLALQKAILEKRKEQVIKDGIAEQKRKGAFSTTNKRGRTVVSAEENALKIAEAERKLGIEFDKNNEKSLKNLETSIKLNEQLQFISEFQAPTDEIRELLNPMRAVLDLSTSIRTGFEESFKGIIKGTMSVQDAFRNMLGRIADHFLDTAARLAAAQIQKGFLSLFSNMFNFNLPVNDTQELNLTDMAKYSRASGGPVQGGTSYLVGEKGPEIFTPGISGGITPNHALGGSTSIVVNVDASGSSVEGDEDQGRELGRLISVAVQSELIQQQRPGGLLA